MKRDKLARYCTGKTAILTQEAQVPFWCTLTPRERSGIGLFRGDLESYFRRRAADRRAFRNFIRSLCR